MNVLLCVKQVPDTMRFAHCGEADVLPEDSLSFSMNPLDKYALEAAARLKDRDPETRITALSMGPEGAEQVLKECLALAADTAYLLCDKLFDGSDSLAVSHALSAAVKTLEVTEGRFDIILCGKQAADSDEGHIGPQLAEWLDYPQVTCGLEIEADGPSLTVRKETEGGVQIVAVPTPCVVTVTKSAWECRYPDILRMMESNGAEIPVLRADSLSGLDLTKVGWLGSPSYVKKIVSAPGKPGRIRIEEKSEEDSARKLYQLLNDAAIL
ncbi:MAG: electron transfer flavoprotein subunit beta/FixA family protein [Pseudoflavonifractor sp.]|nr:electron transfer flavoprotein subunit beta/FixA family protein [Pseudoflavonifractor sp.]